LALSLNTLPFFSTNMYRGMPLKFRRNIAGDRYHPATGFAGAIQKI
jgi:hypothetical protein